VILIEKGRKVMSAKTKNELMEEIEQKNEEIRVLDEEVKRLEKYKTYDQSAEEIKGVMDSYIHSGKPIGVVLYKDDEAITVQLTDEAKHDPQIMKLFGFNRVTSMNFEIKGGKNK